MLKSSALTLVLGVMIGLLAAGGLFLLVSPPRGAPVELLPPPSPALMQVHVAGAVARPGVYALPSGSRVEAAIAAAGGLSDEAAAESLNLAARLRDGERVYVPGRAALGDPVAEQGLADAGADAQADQASTPSALVDINTASQSELESLPGIGPVTAQKIIAYRQENGAFTSIEQIMEVSGIGEGIFAKIKDLITVGS
jgi:competence protein ComEA